MPSPNYQAMALDALEQLDELATKGFSDPAITRTQFEFLQTRAVVFSNLAVAQATRQLDADVLIYRR